MKATRLKELLTILMAIATCATYAQGLISHNFNDGKMGPFVDCTTQNPNYTKVVNNRLRTYWKQTSYSSSNRMTKGAEACGDPVHNGVGYITYKHCWMGFTMNIDKDYMQGDVGVGGLAQVFGFDLARGQSTWTAMLDMKDGDLAWMDRRGSGNTRADVVIYENYPRGVDMDIIIHNVLSGNNKGLVEIFVNGVLKYSAYNINIGMGEFDINDIQTNQSSTEFKIGQYNHSDAAVNEIRIVDYDNVSWYDGVDGYDIVNPNPSPTCVKTTAKTEAECYDSMFGITSETCSEGGQNIGNIHNGDWTVYNNIDLTGMNSIQLRVASKNTAGGTVEVRLGSITGTLIASVPVTNTGDWQTYVTKEVNIKRVTGAQNIYLVFKGGAGGLMNINWFGFSDKVFCANTPALIEAECYTSMLGIQTENCSEGTLNVGYINNGDWLAFNGLNLTGMKSIKARVSGKTNGSTIEVRTGSETGTLIATIPVSNTGGNQTWVTDSVNLATVTGTQNVFLVFKGAGAGYLFNINSFGFSDKVNIVTGFENTETSDFEIYPNPVSASFKVQNKLGAKIELYNSNGIIKLSEQATSDDYSINVSDFAQGTYFIKITDNQGSIHGKIIKQ